MKNMKTPFYAFNINKVRNDYYNQKLNQKENENEFSSTSSVTEDKKIVKKDEQEVINQNENNLVHKNENINGKELSSSNSVTEDKKSENKNEIKIIKSKEATTIINKKEDQYSSNNMAESIPIDYIKTKFVDTENLDTNYKTENSVNKNPIYYIPFKKIFKEDIKKIDIDELKYNVYKENKKDIPVTKRRKENEMFTNEKSNFNSNFSNPVFSGFNKNEYNSQNLPNLQNNSNLSDYLKIQEEEKKFNQQLKFGLLSLLTNGNLNSYLLNMYINNGINNYNSFLNYNQFNPFNNNMNYYGNYIYNNCFPNNNIINNLQHQKNINLSNINNPEKYTITLKSKTNDPSIEKIAKIQVTTSFVKDNSKMKQENNDNPKNQNIKNVINLNDIINGKEKRTVVRLNPIPPNYSSFDVCKLLDMHLKIESGKHQRIYKALYTPLCKVIGKNLGYCFVMMVKPKYVIDFYNVFNGKIFGKKKCKKPCKVIWADIQGKEFLKANEDDPIRKPIIFKDIIIDKDDK